MVNIQLDSRHRITSDRHQFILQRESRNIGFYPNLEDLIQEYFLIKLRDSDSKSIKELLEYHKTLLSSLQQVLTPLQIEVKRVK